MIEFQRTKPIHDTLSVAPLIDIIFLLLLFFLLTSVFIDPGIPLNLPEASNADFQEEQQGTILYISKAGELYVNEQFIPYDDLFDTLVHIIEGNPNKNVTIKADKEAAFGVFVRVMDLAKEAGGKDLVIAAEFPQK